MGPEMEIVVEETASVKEVSLDALKSLCHAWVRSAACREPCFVPVPLQLARRHRIKGSVSTCLELSPSSKETSYFLWMNVVSLLHAWLATPFINNNIQNEM